MSTEISAEVNPRPWRKRVTALQQNLEDRQKARDEVARRITNQLGLPARGPGDDKDEMGRRLRLALQMVRRSKMPSMKPLLPLFLQLKGKPYTLDDYFPFEPWFRVDLPRKQLYICGRQVSKSTSMAAQGVLRSASIPYLSTLYITPLYEMIRRFSHNYVRQFIETSPIRRLFCGAKTINSVLQRSFKNGSVQHFSFAFLDANRCRGIPADGVGVDECQDLNYDLLSIILESLSGSQWGIQQYSGTPKSLDNTIARLWGDSSQAEFIIRCHQGGCNYWNVPALSHDLCDMIGKWHRDISPACPGVLCAKCRRPLDPRRFGRWVHAYPERRYDFAGYHVPQIIMPMHYADQEKWDILIGKMQGRANTAVNVFFNEVCGESYDVGAKLVTVTELKAACCLKWKNTVDDASLHTSPYLYRVLGVDWGGGGGRLAGSNTKKANEQRERTSFTTLAVIGLLPNGNFDVLWGYRSLRTHDYEYEARLVIAAMKKFRCSHLAHDYNGSGAAREVLVRQSGVPMDNIVPIAYHVTARHNIMNFHPATDDHPRDWYSVDKSRSLQLICQMIKHGLLRFFEYDYHSSDDAGLVHDFLALIEEKVQTRLGSDIYVITKNANLTDDFAHSVNLGVQTLCYLNNQQWPNLAAAIGLAMPEELIQFISPNIISDWDDVDVSRVLNH